MLPIVDKPVNIRCLVTFKEFHRFECVVSSDDKTLCHKSSLQLLEFQIGAAKREREREHRLGSLQFIMYLQNSVKQDSVASLSSLSVGESMEAVREFLTSSIFFAVEAGGLINSQQT